MTATTAAKPFEVKDISKLAHNADVYETVADATGGKVAFIEPKFDGIRLFAQVVLDGYDDEGNEIRRTRLWTRLGNEKTGYLQHVESRVAEMFPAGSWLDGEAVAFTVNEAGAIVHEWGGAQSVLGGNPKPAAKQETITYVAFDLIAHGGIDARPAKFSQRRAVLESVFDGSDTTVILSPLSPATEAAHEANLAAGFEGSMVKLADARYASGRRGHGQGKLKPQTTADAFVIGYKDGEGSFAGLVGALVLGMYDDDGNVVEVARASGFSYAERVEISEDREGHLGMVCEFAYHAAGFVRHPQWKRWRTGEKSAEMCLLSDLKVSPMEAEKVSALTTVETVEIDGTLEPVAVAPKAAKVNDFDPTQEVRTGRSGSGNLRNFKQMKDEKFADALAAMEAEANDPEALQAAYAERDRRNAVSA